MSVVLVLNADYGPLHRVSLRHAIRMLFREVAVVHCGCPRSLIPAKDAQALYDACGSHDKTLRVFNAEEGGAQHCQRDYLTLGTATMWSWFEDKLK